VNPYIIGIGILVAVMAVGILTAPYVLTYMGMEPKRRTKLVICMSGVALTTIVLYAGVTAFTTFLTLWPMGSPHQQYLWSPTLIITGVLVACLFLKWLQISIKAGMEDWDRYQESRSHCSAGPMRTDAPTQPYQEEEWDRVVSRASLIVNSANHAYDIDPATAVTVAQEFAHRVEIELAGAVLKRFPEKDHKVALKEAQVVVQTRIKRAANSVGS